MAWTPLYLLKKDVDLLNDFINDENEIAFLIPNGDGKWIAKHQHIIANDLGNQKLNRDFDFKRPNFAEYKLWHVPSGQLPLLSNFGDDSFVSDPWEGWNENRQGANPNVPYFGAGHPGIISLEIQLPNDLEIPLSNFGWIGNHYRIIGNGAEKSTEVFWNKLKRWVKKTATQIPRCNYSEGKKEIFAFPAAYEEIVNGRPCALN